MPRPLKVFLCHDSKDKPVVQDLYEALKSEDWIDPWLDKERILPGQNWQAVIEQAVDEADAIIICLSNQSVMGDGYVQKEIRFAYDLALEKPEDDIFLIPLRLDEVSSIPRRLHSYHWMDYFGDQKQNEYHKLLTSLRLRHEQKIKREISSAPSKTANVQPQVKDERPVFVDRGSHIQTAVTKIKAKNTKPTAQIPEEQRAAKEPLEKKSSKNLVTYIAGVFLFLAICSVGIFYLSKRFISTEGAKTPIFTELPTAAAIEILAATEPSAATESPMSSREVSGSPSAEKDGMKLVYIPAGEFMLGSDQGDADERPLQTTFLDAFWIDQTEVTNKMYAMCVADGACVPPSHMGSPNEKVYYGNSKYENYPVIYVNWDAAKAYCQWAGRDLPTEFQWEKAARGTDGHIYPWGDKFDGTLLNYCDQNCPNLNKLDKRYNDGNVNLAPVGRYQSGASVYGVLDMSGNVWEWVGDWYNVYPGGKPTASIDFGEKFRVIRGGSWIHNMYEARSSNRWYFSVGSDAFNDYTGFRCASSE